MSDRIGRNLAYVLIYGTQVVIFFVVGGVHALPLVALLFAIVLLDYGGGFGTMPSFTADYFGTKYMGVNYGWILLAWGVGGIVGPIFVARGEGPDRLVRRRAPDHRGDAAVRDAVLPLLTRRPGATREPRTRWAHLRPPRRTEAH